MLSEAERHRVQLSGAKFQEVSLICSSIVPLHWGHTRPERSVVVHGWISTCNVAKELETCSRLRMV